MSKIFSTQNHQLRLDTVLYKANLYFRNGGILLNAPRLAHDERAWNKRKEKWGNGFAILQQQQQQKCHHHHQHYQDQYQHQQVKSNNTRRNVWFSPFLHHFFSLAHNLYNVVNSYWYEASQMRHSYTCDVLTRLDSTHPLFEHSIQYAWNIYITTTTATHQRRRQQNFDFQASSNIFPGPFHGEKLVGQICVIKTPQNRTPQQTVFNQNFRNENETVCDQIFVRDVV